VKLVSARHWSARQICPTRNIWRLWASFVIATPGGIIYFAPTSSYGDGWHFRRARERTDRSGWLF